MRYLITNVETIISGLRGMNPVAITIISPRRETSQARDSNKRPFNQVLRSKYWSHTGKLVKPRAVLSTTFKNSLRLPLQNFPHMKVERIFSVG